MVDGTNKHVAAAKSRDHAKERFHHVHGQDASNDATYLAPRERGHTCSKETGKRIGIVVGAHTSERKNTRGETRRGRVREKKHIEKEAKIREEGGRRKK
jgi:hypothetical protein